MPKGGSTPRTFGAPARFFLPLARRPFPAASALPARSWTLRPVSGGSSVDKRVQIAEDCRSVRGGCFAVRAVARVAARAAAPGVKTARQKTVLPPSRARVRQARRIEGGSMTFSVLDIGLGILILLFLVRGLLRGLINEVAGLVGLFLGFILAGRYYPQLVPQFAGVIESPKLASVAAYAVIFVAVLIVVALCAAIVKRLMVMTLTAWLDNLLGALIGAAKGVFIASIVLALMVRFVPDSPFLKNSLLAEHIEALVAFSRSLLPAFLGAGA